MAGDGVVLEAGAAAAPQAEVRCAAAPQAEAFYGAAKDKLEMRIGARMDHYARDIMLNGLRRPLMDYAWHGAILLVNYLGLLLLLASVPRPVGMDQWSYNMLIFVKLVVWQHLAEAIGCRQGPLMGHASLPNNYKFRLSRGTLKCTLLPGLGNKRTLLDLTVHVVWFACNLGFLLSPGYQMLCIRSLCACNAWIFVFDTSQFHVSQGHAYGTMLLAACFAVDSGRLAGLQLALIMQWFFAGLGKVGPWFPYVTGPFLLQSRILQGQRWLFNLLLKSEDDLSPTLFGKCAGHFLAWVEYASPLALMATASGALVWLGLLALTGMHACILTLPAPLDVYSWNLCFGLSGIYLFSIGSFGFDWSGAASMSPALAAVLFTEFCLCWYGQFFPDQVGACLSHRYWAGNWVQCFFLAKRTEAVHDKLAKVKTFSGNPVGLPEATSSTGSVDSDSTADSLSNTFCDEEVAKAQRNSEAYFYESYSYLWTTALNMKFFVRLVEDAISSVDGAKSCFDNWQLCSLAQYCCGDIRDPLYAPTVATGIQEECGFDEGECLMIRIGAFGSGRTSTSWAIHDLKTGIVKEGSITQEALCQLHSYPSQSLELAL